MEGLSVNVRSNASSVAMEFSAAAREMRDTALVRALNHTADRAKVVGAREVRDTGGYKIKIGTIKACIKVKRASQSNLRASVVAKGQPIPIIEFGAKQTSKGVTISVQKGRKLLPGAFIATMPSGHKGVFYRKGNLHKKIVTGGKASWHGLPIKEVFGPSVPDGLANKAVQDAVLAFIGDVFEQRLQHEHTWLRRKLGDRAG